MASFIDEVATYLDTQSVGVFTLDTGRNIFTEQQPPLPDNCITIFGLAGTDPQQAATVPNLHFHRFQVVVRNTDYDTCQTKLAAVRAALHGKYDLLFANWRVLRCHIDYEGHVAGLDDQGRHEAVLNFRTESNAQVNP